MVEATALPAMPGSDPISWGLTQAIGDFPLIEAEGWGSTTVELVASIDAYTEGDEPQQIASNVKQGSGTINRWCGDAYCWSMQTTQEFSRRWNCSPELFNLNPFELEYFAKRGWVGQIMVIA